MSNETQITITGNLVDEVELRFTPTGQPVARFRVASTPRYLDKTTNEWKDGGLPVPDLQRVAAGR